MSALLSAWGYGIDSEASSMAMEGLFGLTFLAGGLVGYGLRSLISQRRHRRARATRQTAA